MHPAAAYWVPITNPYEGFGEYKKLIIDHIDQLHKDGVEVKMNLAPQIAKRFGIPEYMANNCLMDWVGVMHWRNTYGE